MCWKVIAALPSRLDFGSVPPGGQATRTVYFRGDGSALALLPAQIAVTPSPETAVSSALSSPARPIESKAVAVTLRVPTDAPSGPIASRLRVAVDGKKPFELTVPFRAHVAAPGGPRAAPDHAVPSHGKELQ